MTFNEITKNVVQESIARPREIDQNLVDAQQARRVLDRIVGYELSPLLWKKVRRGLSAGRVQSVATRMVDEREKEIESLRARRNTGRSTRSSSTSRAIRPSPRTITAKTARSSSPPPASEIDAVMR